MSGFDTRVEYKGFVFIVQTQDKGLNANYVESLIYESGEVLASKKAFYTSSLNSPDLKKTIDQLMQDLHKSVLDEIAQGKFDRFLEEENKT
jgi:hypothetical protein